MSGERRRHRRERARWRDRRRRAAHDRPRVTRSVRSRTRLQTTAGVSRLRLPCSRPNLAASRAPDEAGSVPGAFAGADTRQAKMLGIEGQASATFATR